MIPENYFSVIEFEKDWTVYYCYTHNSQMKGSVLCVELPVMSEKRRSRLY